MEGAPDIESLLATMSDEKKREFLALLHAKKKRDAVLEGLFDKQKSFVLDAARFKAAVCSRRAGKTYGIIRKLVKVSLDKPKSTNLYITKTRKAAKQIVWADLKECADAFGGEPHEGDLSIKFPNGSVIYVLGANDRGKIEDYRGLALGCVVIDEAQNLPPFIEELVEAVIAPALIDFHGELILIGTPPPVAAGYFYECWTNDGWSRHYWTVEDNPHIPNARDFIESECKRRGLSLDDPLVQREWFGKWVMDTDNLVLTYEQTKNDYDFLPAGEWRHVIGVDLGFEDSDAVAVIAYSDTSPNAYLVHEDVRAHQGITELGDVLRPLVERYDPDIVVWDAGGLGKKVAHTVTARLGIPLVAAEKTQKIENLALLNDALRTGRFKAKLNSRFAADCRLVEWDREKSTPDKRVISDRYHSDINDAVLYAARHSGHWLYEKPEEKPAPGSRAAREAEADEYLRRLEKRYQDEQSAKRWWGMG